MDLSKFYINRMYFFSMVFAYEARIRTIAQHSKKRLELISYHFGSFFGDGEKYSCSCCGAAAIKFRSFGTPPRPNVMCPRCGSLERHRLLSLYLKNETDFFSANLSVLHFAPESCFQSFAGAPNLRYVSADLVSPLAMTRADIEHI